MTLTIELLHKLNFGAQSQVWDFVGATGGGTPMAPELEGSPGIVVRTTNPSALHRLPDSSEIPSSVKGFSNSLPRLSTKKIEQVA